MSASIQEAISPAKRRVMSMSSQPLSSRTRQTGSIWNGKLRRPTSMLQTRRSEQLDGVLGDARFDLLPQQAMRHRVEVAADVDVIVYPDATLAPLGIDVRFDRQGGERRAIELVEQLAPADTETAHGSAVEFAEQSHDGGVELGQRQEALVAQAGEDPALDHLHADLDPSP